MVHLDPSALFVLLGMCVALYVQNLTGFAFSLLFLGFVGVFDLMPISVAANAATIIALVQTAFFLRQEGLGSEWKVVRPALVPAVLGVVAGAALLSWLGNSQLMALRFLLGAVIVMAAVTMLLEVHKRSTLSGAPVFRVAGLVSGVMGGLFSAAGPPIVYLLYRQPLPLRVVRHALFVMFGVIQLMRFVYVMTWDRMETPSFVYAAMSIPLAFLVTYGTSRYPLPLQLPTVKRLAALLLVATGLSLAVSAFR
ncbi:MAG: sulfite exporter TauE/SafE family protein [Burkholderiaceae bacterium]|nr:sulfite exporter TauE/SafE family protein [Burkholderiaceae bacterium]